jgi:hypothetical protein
MLKWRGCYTRAASEWITDMTDASEDCDGGDADILTIEVSDAALEAAASAIIPGAAISFPNSPTVSILFQCCG